MQSRERKVYLFRHGFTKGNEQGLVHQNDDSELTDCGLRQAALLAERLAYEPIGDLYTSPTLRARQTANVVGDCLGIKPKINSALREVRTPHDVKLMLTSPELADETVLELMEHGEQGSAIPDELEGLKELQIRAERCLYTFTKQPHRVIAACSHGGFMRALAALIRSNMLGRGTLSYDMFRMEYQSPLENTGLVVLSYHPAFLSGVPQWHVATWNDCSHLHLPERYYQTART